MTRRRGWCPSLYDPMATGDGLLVRVKPPGARLGADAARALAAAAARFGNGAVDLTARGNLQARGLSPGGVDAFAAAMVATGLAHPDPAVERRRAVIAPPLAGDDPGVCADAGPLAASLEAVLASDPDLAHLPGKFCLAVDGGGVLGSARGKGTLGADLLVRCGGACHWIALDGVPGAAPCPPGETVERMRRVLLAAGSRRMRDAVAQDGAAIVWDAAGLVPEKGAQGDDTPAEAAGVPSLRFAPVGFHSYPGTGEGAFGLAPPFGAADARGLAALADLADRFGTGALRVAPWRAVFLGRVRVRDVPALRDAATAAGLVTDPADARLRLAACVGAPGCASATVSARTDAARLAAWGALPSGGGVVHVSGCAKGCAHPGPADAALVGDAGHYAFVRGGRAGDTPVLRGLTLDAAADLLRGTT